MTTTNLILSPTNLTTPTHVLQAISQADLVNLMVVEGETRLRLQAEEASKAWASAQVEAQNAGIAIWKWVQNLVDREIHKRAKVLVAALSCASGGLEVKACLERADRSEEFQRHGYSVVPAWYYNRQYVRECRMVLKPTRRRGRSAKSAGQDCDEVAGWDRALDLAMRTITETAPRLAGLNYVEMEVGGSRLLLPTIVEWRVPSKLWNAYWAATQRAKECEQAANDVQLQLQALPQMERESRARLTRLVLTEAGVDVAGLLASV